MILKVLYRCLWYLRMCLKQENIIGSTIPQENYEILIQQLTIWVFEIENVKSLVQVDEKAYFDVIFLFFTNPAIDIINKTNENIKIRCPPNMNEQETELISIIIFK